jgi:hypothetical protein
MSSTQLKLDQFWSQHEPSSKPAPFSNTNEIKANVKLPSFSIPSARWQPNQRPLVVPSSTFKSISTSSIRTIQLIDPFTMPTPTPTISSLKHIQSTQNLFSIGTRMPEVEIALKQLIANMEKCPRSEEELPQPLSLRNVTLHGYQRHALAWREWRELNPPFGGMEKKTVDK